MNQLRLNAADRVGWQARLSMRYQHVEGSTLLSHKHEGPLRVQRPFFPEGEVNHTYLLHPPGGLVGNDVLSIEAVLDEGAHALLTTPGATKAYRNVCDGASVVQRFEVSGTLEWLPQELILFDGSRVTGDTTFSLGAAGRLIAWEVQCLGRPFGDQPYVTGRARFKTRVVTPAGPLLHDRLSFNGGGALLEAPWGLNGHTALGVMLAYPGDETLLDAARSQAAKPDLTVAATMLDDLMVVRALGDQAQTVRRHFVEIWRHIRPLLLDRAACEPRIWNT